MRRETTLPCGCTIHCQHGTVEKQKTEMVGIARCSLHEHAAELLEALKKLISAIREIDPPDDYDQPSGQWWAHLADADDYARDVLAKIGEKP